MKKKLIVFLCATICFTIGMVGCSDKSEEKEAEKVQYADENFVSDMAKGLEKRWDIVGKTDQEQENFQLGSEKYKTACISIIDAELEQVEKYLDEEFEDDALKELAVKYVDLLKQDKEACENITIDLNKYKEESNSIYIERNKIIQTMSSDYGMKIDKKYGNIIEEIQEHATYLEEKEQLNKEAEEELLEIFEDI